MQNKLLILKKFIWATKHKNCKNFKNTIPYIVNW